MVYLPVYTKTPSINLNNVTVLSGALATKCDLSSFEAGRGKEREVEVKRTKRTGYNDRCNEDTVSTKIEKSVAQALAVIR